MVLVFFHFTFSTFTFFFFALRKFNYAILYALCFNLCNFCFKWSHFELILLFRIQRVFKLSHLKNWRKNRWDLFHFFFLLVTSDDGRWQWMKSCACRDENLNSNQTQTIFSSSSFRVFQKFQLKLKVFPASDFLFETIQLDELGHFSFGGASRKNFMWKAVQNS